MVHNSCSYGGVRLHMAAWFVKTARPATWVSQHGAPAMRTTRIDKVCMQVCRIGVTMARLGCYRLTTPDIRASIAEGSLAGYQMGILGGE